LDQRGMELWKCGENCKTKSFIICTVRQIIRIIKSRRLRWAGHVARMGEKRQVYRLFVGNPEGKKPLQKKT
jgi:hypothetical protein